MSKVTLKGKSYDLSNKTQRETYWTEYAKSKLISKVVKGIFKLDQESLNNMMWDESPNFGIEFTDGSIIFPSADDEGNSAGHFAIRSKSNKIIGLAVVDVRYMTEPEMKKFGFCRNGLVIKLRNPKDLMHVVFIVAQSDAEGNDGGAVFGSPEVGEDWTFPTL